MDTHYATDMPPILVVEPDADLGHVVVLALEHHGHPVRLYHSLADAWEAAQTVPALVVLDAGPSAPGDWSALAALERHRLLGTAPVVLLAWDCSVEHDAAPAQIARVCVAKPFDARALDDAVAALLAPGALPVSDGDASPADIHQEGEESASSRSVWPAVTAAGGFAAVVGFMVHPIYVIAGLVVMLAALLWWAFEPGEASAHV